MLWHLYVGHHHPFSQDGNTLSPCLQVVDSPCYPIHKVSFSLYFERKYISWLKIIGIDSFQLATSLWLFQDSAQERAAKVQLRDFECQTGS